MVREGSSDPPGDRIDFVAYTLPGELDLKIEVRAYAVRIDGTRLPKRLRATDPKFQDAEGQLSVIETATVNIETRVAIGKIVIPFAAMEPQPEEYCIGYEVRMYVDDQVHWIQGLPITSVDGSRDERQSFQPRGFGPSENPPVDHVRAYVSDGAGQALREAALDLVDSPDISNQAKSMKASGSGKNVRSLAPITASGKDVRSLAPSAASGSLGSGGRTQAWLPESAVDSDQTRVVYFATNRAERVREQNNKQNGDNGKLIFGSEIGETTYGQCRVNVPIRHHRRGNLETVNWWAQKDPDRHFFVDAISAIPKDELASIASGDTLVFVHGFYNTFESAVVRAAQIRHDLDFAGKAVAFSWPSVGSISAYKEDAEVAEKSVGALADLLDCLARRETQNGEAANAPRVHIIAHSMGTRILVQAIYELHRSGRWSNDNKLLGQVILAAPDIGAAQFNNLVGYTSSSCQRLSYYYCRADSALAVSQGINRYEPVGLHPYFTDGVDTISADGAGTGFIGHDYYAASPKVLADFYLLITGGYEPKRRLPPLATRISVFGHEHWSFLPVKLAKAEPIENR